MRTLKVLSAAVAALFLCVPCWAVSWKQCLGQSEGWYGGDEAVRIAENVLLYQRNHGGWGKNVDMARPLESADRESLLRDKARDDSTIDNGATCTQLRYLARVYAGAGQERFKEAFLRGIDYLLRAQYSNGGWPQFYPRTSGYHGHITFNDNAMVNVLTVLRDVSAGKGPYGFVDTKRRQKAAAAVARGIDCILRCQIIVDGRRLGWCAQHDEKTLKPAGARSYEKASLSGAESAGIVRFLMEIEDPGQEVVEAVNSAIAWFEDVKVTNVRQVSKPAPGTPRGRDKVLVADRDAPPIWARFYEVGTNRPIFCSRDGIIRYSMSEISYERRNGYAWYTSGPRLLIEEDYPAWKKRIAGR